MQYDYGITITQPIIFSFKKFKANLSLIVQLQQFLLLQLQFHEMNLIIVVLRLNLDDLLHGGYIGEVHDNELQHFYLQ